MKIKLTDYAIKLIEKNDRKKKRQPNQYKLMLKSARHKKINWDLNENYNFDDDKYIEHKY